MQNKGFTLIELLVVIAIIGILAGIIVVSMGGAQQSANNAKVKATLSQLRSAAELAKINSATSSTYQNAFPANGEVDKLITGINNVIDAAPDAVTMTADYSKWCYSLTLLGTAGNLCVDSTGFIGTPTAVGTCAVGTGYCVVP
ncbi:MAG: prepilin-type N-terminal cleavage/methylation domain-containing protein [Candidatus Pacebacteria bacterium]|nr:prepilin-type N-terminal cleavage/methylation domain-containing protein [Candidatus Paceibacterota bacterium]